MASSLPTARRGPLSLNVRGLRWQRRRPVDRPPWRLPGGEVRSPLHGSFPFLPGFRGSVSQAAEAGSSRVRTWRLAGVGVAAPGRGLSGELALHLHFSRSLTA